MLRLSVSSAQGLVRDALDQRLHEPVLATFRRARVRVEHEHLLAHECCEERLERILRELAHGGEAARSERLAEDGGVLEQVALVRIEPVEACRDQRLQRLGNVERREIAGDVVPAFAPLQQAAVEEHAYRLDGVERRSVRTGADPVESIVRQTRNQAEQELVDRSVTQRLEGERRVVADV